MYSKDRLRIEIKKLLWDTNRNADDYLALIGKENKNESEVRILRPLYIKFLNFYPWYEIIRMFGYEKARNEIVTDDVIQGLFPRPLRKKYRYVKQLL